MKKSGMNQERLQKANRELVLRLLRKDEQYSRAEIAKRTKLQPATITNIINEFREMDLVREEGSIKEGRGRSAIGLRLNADRLHFIGIRLSRKYYYIGRFNLNGTQIVKRKYDIPKGAKAEDIISSLKENCRELISSDTRHEVAAIGVAVPGPYIRQTNAIALITGFEDWQNISLKEELSEAFGIDVFVEHDANAAALAAYWKMGAMEEQSLVYIAAGQGIGAGIVVDGELYIGKTGTAGEIGHMSICFDGPICQCGNHGCLENYCSSIALTKRIQQMIREGNYSTLDENCKFEDILSALAAGDRLAAEAYTQACAGLAVGVVNVINSFNPDTVIIGDEMVGAAPEIMSSVIKKAVKQRVLPQIAQATEVLIEEDDSDEMLKGAGIMAIDEMLQRFLAKT